MHVGLDCLQPGLAGHREPAEVVGKADFSCRDSPPDGRSEADGEAEMPAVSATYPKHPENEYDASYRRAPRTAVQSTDVKN
jgi:hypothetical protein